MATICSGSVTALCVFFFFALLALHFAFVYQWPFSANTWRKADYWWLAFLVLGLVGAAGDVRRARAPDEVTTREARLTTSLSIARFVVSGGYHCMHYVRSDFSPPNLEEIQAQRDRLCAWTREILNALPEAAPVEVDDLELLSALSMPAISNAPLISEAQDVEEAIEDLHAAADSLNQARALLEPTSWEQFWTFFYPPLLALALALRITKVTGEVRLTEIGDVLERGGDASQPDPTLKQKGVPNESDVTDPRLDERHSITDTSGQK